MDCKASLTVGMVFVMNLVNSFPTLTFLPEFKAIVGAKFAIIVFPERPDITFHDIETFPTNIIFNAYLTTEEFLNLRQTQDLRGGIIIRLDCPQSLSAISAAIVLYQSSCDSTTVVGLSLQSQVFSFTSPVNGSIFLFEHYALKGTLIKEIFGIWTLKKGLIVPQPELCVRRSDLKGISLRGVALSWAPLTNIIETEQGVAIDGLANDIMELLQSMLNFQVRFVTNGNRTWSGMAEEVSQNKADLILSPLSSTHKREKLIDYSMAITENQLVLISKKTTFNPPLLNIWVYFDPFKSMVWLVMISVVIVTSFMLFVMNFEVKSICILFTHILALLIQRPLDLDLTQTSSKLLQLFIAIWALFIFVTYNGNLTSTMTIQSPPPEIDTLEEILAQKRHLVMWRSTVLTDRYENASKGTLKNRVWEYLINADYQSFITSSDELMDLFQKDPRLIYFGEVLELTPITDYEFLPVKFESKAILAFGLAKESAIRCLFDYRLLKLRNLGIFHKLYYKWIDPNARDVANMEVYPFGFENVVFPFAVLGVGVIVSGIQAIIERVSA